MKQPIELRRTRKFSATVFAHGGLQHPINMVAAESVRLIVAPGPSNDTQQQLFVSRVRWGVRDVVREKCRCSNQTR